MVRKKGLVRGTKGTSFKNDYEKDNKLLRKGEVDNLDMSRETQVVVTTLWRK